MPRTSSPTNLKDSQLVISIKQEIDSKGWQAVRNSVVIAYQQRLSDIEQKRGQLSDDEFKKKRFKRLSETELMTLRARIKRLQRKTICFSKSEEMHDIVSGLFINKYEFNLSL
ncbi:IS1 family transposase [Aphanothece hegewaldii]|uniref:IS1 family transposase n=1 Tax=Aphanothece hegewaldii TaxID=1521625 RepID=UPI001C639AF3